MANSSSRKYTSNGLEIFNTGDNLVLGHPQEYTAKFYKILSIIVDQPTKIKLNNDIVTVMPQSGWLVHPEYNEPIYHFSVEEPNKPLYYSGEW